MTGLDDFEFDLKRDPILLNSKGKDRNDIANTQEMTPEKATSLIKLLGPDFKTEDLLPGSVFSLGYHFNAGGISLGMLGPHSIHFFVADDNDTHKIITGEEVDRQNYHRNTFSPKHQLYDPEFTSQEDIKHELDKFSKIETLSDTQMDGLFELFGKEFPNEQVVDAGGNLGHVHGKLSTDIEGAVAYAGIFKCPSDRQDLKLLDGRPVWIFIGHKFEPTKILFNLKYKPIGSGDYIRALDVSDWKTIYKPLIDEEI